MGISLKVCPILAAAVGLVSTASPAAAAGDWTVSVQAATDYISKGISKNGGDPAVSAMGEHAFGKTTYAGAFVTQAETSQGANSEIQIYAGIKPEFGGVKWDFRAFYKNLPGTAPGIQNDLFEVRADANKTVAGNKIRLRVEYSPDSYAATEQAWWLEAQIARLLTSRINASAAIARREQDGGADYTAWNAGATVTLTKVLALDLRYYDTGAHSLGSNYDSRAYASLVAKF
ncbi:MAG: TorF family putative porin [Caulobacteraceae bacterium]